jgi:3-hydroxyacyl-[acyl-carrier-protein] dehydratase
MRYLMLDRIVELAPPSHARGVKVCSLSEDFLADHFPGHPVMPGALILEGLAQLGGVLVEATLRERGRTDLHALLLSADKARFRQLVRPGDRVELEALGEHATEDGGRVRGVARVDGVVVAEALLTFALVKVTNPRVIERRREYLNIWLYGSAEAP